MKEQEQRIGDDWIDYLEQTGNYESYDGMCDCLSCRKIREGYFVWKETNSSPRLRE